MAIDYVALKAAVEQWVENVAGAYLGADENGTPYVWWFEDAHERQGNPHASLKLTDAGRQGRDQVEWVEDAGTRTLSPRTTGNRQVVVGVTVRSRADANIPRLAIDELRTSLEDPIDMQQLQDAGGLAFVAIEGVQTGIGIVYQGRREALATLDVRFSLTATRFDDSRSVEIVEDAGLTNDTTDQVGDPVDPGATEELVGVKNPL